MGGLAIFGRIVRVETFRSDLSQLEIDGAAVRSEGRIQLLASIEFNGQSRKGIAKYPRIGDHVYSASLEVIQAVVLSKGTGKDVSLGSLPFGEESDIRISVDRLIGRHLAIVGSTGSGKSWTLAQVSEQIASLNGRMILIDATGEFATLGPLAHHLTFGSTYEEDASTLVCLPHFLMQESDRNAFLNPSAGAQLPKLREAIRSLRLAHVLSIQGATNDFLTDGGCIVKAGLSRVEFNTLISTYSSEVESSTAPFDLHNLADQIVNECIWATSNRGVGVFGGTDEGAMAYVSSLVSRTRVLADTREITNVIAPTTATNNVFEEIRDWLENGSTPILRISLRNLTYSNYLREIVVNIIARELLSMAREKTFAKRPLLLGIDEAHQFFDVRIGDEFSRINLDAVGMIAREGRKYGLTLCLATQRPSDLPSTVLSQIGMIIAHRIADGPDRQRIENAAAELDLSAIRLLTGLVPGDALLMGSDFPLPLVVSIHEPTCKPFIHGPNYEVGWTN